MHIDYQFYKKIVFVDSNIILEAKPLIDLPWDEVDAEGPILVLMVPTVLREIDSKKRDGRLAIRAREFNRRMAQIIDSGESACLRSIQPRVDINFASIEKIDWNIYDDLDSSEGDCKVIAEVLNAKYIDTSLVIVLSQDIAPLLYASRHNLQVMRASEAWMQAPEQSPVEKEVARLRRQVADFSKTEPEITVDLEFVASPKIYKVEQLSTERQLDLITRIQDSNPRHNQQQGWGIGSSLGYDSSYDRKYEEFIAGVPDFVESLPKRLELLYCQIPMKILVSNSGGLRAENLHIELQVVGGWLNERPIFVSGFPIAPKPDPYRNLMPPHLLRHRDDSQPEIGRHEIELSELNRSVRATLQCADFRHGQKWSHNPILWVDPHFLGEAKIVVVVTAANKRGATTKAFSVVKEVATVTPFDLIDDVKGRAKADFHVKELIENLLKEERYDDVEFLKKAS